LNTDTDTIPQLRSFIQSYCLLDHEIALREIAPLKALTVSFEQKQCDLHELLRLDAPDYNLFEVLRIRHYEVKVHTPFIAHLLNPLTNHHQGRLFFDLFFRDIIQYSKPTDNLSNIEVHVERRNLYGQIDIQIWFRENGIKKVVVIENKIYHHDGDEQLYRYYQYLSQSRRLSDENLQIIYLTLDGRPPSKNSLGTIPSACIRSISYRGHINQWLTTAMASINPNPLYHTINQYLKTINSL